MRLIADSGDPAAKILEHADRLTADLIMMPTHGMGLARSLLIGSVTARVLHGAQAPVWCAHLDNGLTPALDSILCTTDRGPGSQDTMNWAKAFAEQTGAQLHSLEAAESKGGEAVADHARDIGASLIVIGRGYPESRMLRLRTHVYPVINRAPCPVISV